MYIQVVKSKIHRVTVTGANLDYIGSITIDEDLMDAAGIVAGERVYIVDNNNGERLDTYVIAGERGKGEICLNGAAARKVMTGDVVIIMAYGYMTPEEARDFKPKVVFPDNESPEPRGEEANGVATQVGCQARERSRRGGGTTRVAALS